MTETSDPVGASPRPPYLHAAIAGVAVATLYALTLAPTTAFWDTSEYIATAHILGIPHQPGNPLFLVLGRAWDLLLSPFGISTAVRINLLSACMSAAAHAFWFLVAHHVLRFFSKDRLFRLAGSFAAVAISATAFTVWSQSNVNEKVYTVSLFTIALISWLILRWQETMETERGNRILVLIVFLLALTVGNHMMGLLAAPSVALFILFVKPRVFLNLRLYVAGAVAAALGISIFFFLPIRAKQDPVISEADPVCESITEAVVSVYTMGYAEEGCVPLSNSLQRSQYQKPPLIPRQAPFEKQLLNWFQYFDWQWARGLSDRDVLFGSARMPLTILFLGLGVYGFIRHCKRDPAGCTYLWSLFLVLSAALVWYLNFKYGYTIPDEVGNNRDLHEVRERDYFFVAGFSLWGVLAGIGLAQAWKAVSQATGASLKATSPVLAIALLPLVLNFSWANRSGEYFARDWAYDVLMSAEPYAIIFTSGDNDTFPLWYLQEVEGIRQDVTVAVTSYMNTGWYIRQLRDITRPCEPEEDPTADPTVIICQRPYEPENLPAIFTHDPSIAQAQGKVALLLDEPARAPERGAISQNVTDEVIAQFSDPKVLEEDTYWQLGPVLANMPAGSELWPYHQFIMSALSSSLEDRPVYFTSALSIPYAMGMYEFIVREGLLFRLWPGYVPDPPPNPGIVATQDASVYASVIGPYVNGSRSAILADSVYAFQSGDPSDWDVWKDHSTSNIPLYYSWLYLALSDYGGAMGLEGETAAWTEQCARWGELSGESYAPCLSSLPSGSPE